MGYIKNFNTILREHETFYNSLSTLFKITKCTQTHTHIRRTYFSYTVLFFFNLYFGEKIPVSERALNKNYIFLQSKLTWLNTLKFMKFHIFQVLKHRLSIFGAGKLWNNIGYKSVRFDRKRRDHFKYPSWIQDNFLFKYNL